MNDAKAQTIRRADYRPPAFLVDDVHLTFRLHPKQTIVTSRIHFRPNPEVTERRFELHGECLSLKWARIDGRDSKPHFAGGILTADVPDVPFIWEAEVEIDPSSNTALEGLYISNGIYCTQCEAEGFRRITFYPDRPDVMARFTVRIESDDLVARSNGEPVPDSAELPVLLSNGNPVASGPGWAEWHDPWPKPSYLFALVAGNLVAHTGTYRTVEGRDVTLNIWVRPGDEDRCAYALDALKRSMEWDERVYGRAYDLDVFNLVAVDDFNAGAMENKGLNIFNSKYVLASPETATDRDYESIEGIVAHEYFHNWTGNRITCRDWFQLCLKEGLTVFRDQQFCGDMRSHAVKRIDDVLMLRARQFREDAGPLAHPVRPAEFQEINNFYTATVYEKGAEVIRMLKTLVGDDAYSKALDLYFDRHDGEAATIEDWLKVFEDTTGRDLTQFKRWYTQAGTPRVSVTDTFHHGTYTLDFEQHTRHTPGQFEKSPQVIPIAVGLIGPNGDEVVPTTVLELTDERQSFSFDGLGSRPIPSLLRNFSAPVILERQTSKDERLHLLAHDTDPFNRWEAGRQLGKEELVSRIANGSAPSMAWLDSIERLANDESLDPAFRALALSLPSEDDMAQTLHENGVTPDPGTIHDAREGMLADIGKALRPTLTSLYNNMDVPGTYTPDATSAGRRSLRLKALNLLVYADEAQMELAVGLFATTDNMTESLGTLSILLGRGEGEKQAATFYEKWRNDSNVLDKWFATQIANAAPEKAVARAEALMRHPDFHWKTPNRFRAVIGALAGNAAGFHDPSGAGYRLVADWLIRLDPVNPQTAARMATIFETWTRYDGDRQDMMRDVLNAIRSTRGLSPDMNEMVSRMLDARPRESRTENQ